MEVRYCTELSGVTHKREVKNKLGFDYAGNVIYSADVEAGTEEWLQADTGLPAKRKSPKRLSEVVEYDKNKVKVCIYRYSEGRIMGTTFCNPEGKDCHCVHPNGFEAWFEYDERGRLVHGKNTYGEESWYRYDEYGNRSFHSNGVSRFDL